MEEVKTEPVKELKEPETEIDETMHLLDQLDEVNTKLKKGNLKKPDKLLLK